MERIYQSPQSDHTKKGYPETTEEITMPWILNPFTDNEVEEQHHQVLFVT